MAVKILARNQKSQKPTTVTPRAVWLPTMGPDRPCGLLRLYKQAPSPPVANLRLEFLLEAPICLTFCTSHSTFGFTFIPLHPFLDATHPASSLDCYFPFFLLLIEFFRQLAILSPSQYSLRNYISVARSEALPIVRSLSRKYSTPRRE